MTKVLRTYAALYRALGQLTRAQLTANTVTTTGGLDAAGNAEFTPYLQLVMANDPMLKDAADGVLEDDQPVLVFNQGGLPTDHSPGIGLSDPDHSTGDDELATMEIQLAQIGVLDFGIDGRDQYILLTRKDDDLTPDKARAWLLPQYYHQSNGPGRYYCHTVSATQVEYSTNRVICAVQHRYDV